LILNRRASGNLPMNQHPPYIPCKEKPSVISNIDIFDYNIIQCVALASSVSLLFSNHHAGKGNGTALLILIITSLPNLMPLQHYVVIFHPSIALSTARFVSDVKRIFSISFIWCQMISAIVV
jgi:hypothetical protein